MNFLSKLFSRLKEGHKNGVIITTSCFITILIIGVHGFTGQINQAVVPERKIVRAEEEDSELEETLIIEEDDSAFGLSAVATYSFNRRRMVTNQELTEVEVERQLVTQADQLDESTRRIISKKEYDILVRIVEAEAGGESKDARQMIAGVILNRVDNERFPDNIEGVVFQRTGKSAQFSPISNGSYYRVKIQETTKQAVDKVLQGEDKSQGALYFMVRAISTPRNVRWFDNHLTKVAQKGVIEFYK